MTSGMIDDEYGDDTLGTWRVRSQQTTMFGRTRG